MFRRGSKLKEAQPPTGPDGESKLGDVPSPPIEQRTAKQEERVATSKMKRQNQPKPASNEAVMSRARRLAKQTIRPFAEALGVDPDDEQGLKAKIEELKSAREENMGVVERLESAKKALEEQNHNLKTKLSQTQTDLTKAQRTLQQKEGDLEDLEIEREIERTALQAGVIDLDYAITLFKRHVGGLGENEEPDASVFFEELKASKPILFKEEVVEAGPKPASQQPGAGKAGDQTNPGEETQKRSEGTAQASSEKSQIPDQPAPKPGESGPEEVDASALPSHEFKRRTSEKYGYMPGQA